MDLTDVRKNIDIVDSQIKELFQRRMELADQVAQVKAETGDDIFKPDREVAIIEKQSADIPAEVKQEYVALIKRMMAVSRKYQYGRTLEMRDCLNISWKDRFDEPASVAMIKPELYICNMVSKDIVTTADNFEEVGTMVQNGAVDAGIGILEDISVKAADDLHIMLARKNLYINRCDVVMDSGIRKKVGLFSKDLIVLPEHNRLKVMFVCRNESGSLAAVLSMISDYNANLTEIHSRPNREDNWNYEFYVEFEGNLLTKDTQALVFQLRSETQYFQILGSYFCEGDF